MQFRLAREQGSWEFTGISLGLSRRPLPAPESHAKGQGPPRGCSWGGPGWRGPGKRREGKRVPVAECILLWLLLLGCLW